MCIKWIQIIYLSYIYHISITYVSYVYHYLSYIYHIESYMDNYLSRSIQGITNNSVQPVACRMAIQGIEEALSDFEAKISDLVKGMLERRLHPINVLVMIPSGELT